MNTAEAFEAQQKKIQAALVAVNRSVNSIASEDLTFQRTVSPAVASQLDHYAARLLRLTNGLLTASASATGQRPPPRLDDVEDVELNWKGVVDVIDVLLEKADTNLDEYTGLLKRKNAPTTEDPESKKKQATERLDWSIRRANMTKPQEAFEEKLDNFDKGPWKPILTAKPHALVPLDQSLETFVDEKSRTQHPYQTEIAELHYPESIYQTREPIRFQPVETTQATWVDTFEGVLAMLEELRQADEIAVDLEHHDYRTYTGLLSLMQISTRDKDWIVDTLKPWRRRLEVLNEVFADPTKIKVFHGATSDIVWLQRDLGLYVVGLFDTYFACECLGYPARSLAFLLKKFVDFDADKKYQMADWRIRPLPEEMMYYARSDTHYLLYVYDMVRNELAEKSDRAEAAKDLTGYVLQRSKETSLLRHEALWCDGETGQGSRGWFNSLVRSYAPLSGEQFAVFKALFAWRDELARREDESPGFIMPMRTLTDMARILPPDRKALWSLLTNTARVTKAHMEELWALIQAAKARGTGGPTSSDFLRSDVARSWTASSSSSFAGKGFNAYAAAAASKNREAAASASTSAAAAGPDTAGAVDGPASASQAKQLPLPDVNDLRSGFSQLWGSLLLDSRKTRTQEGEGSAAAVAAAAGVTEIDMPWFSFAKSAISQAGEAATSKTKKRNELDDDFIAFPDSAQSTRLTAGRQAMAPETPTPAGKSAAAKAAAMSDTSSESESSSEEEEDEEMKEEEEEAFTLRRIGGSGNSQKQGAGSRAASSRTKAKTKQKQKQKQKQDVGRSSKNREGEAGEDSSDSDGGARLTADGSGSDFVPFNYDTAGSVLHAKQPSDGKAQQHNGKKKIFNPYGPKADEGPKAARRMHFEKTGKSGTFKK